MISNLNLIVKEEFTLHQIATPRRNLPSAIILVDPLSPGVCVGVETRAPLNKLVATSCLL